MPVFGHNEGVPTGRDPLAVVVEMMTAVALAPDHLEKQVDAIIDILLLETAASVGLLVRADVARWDVQVLGRMLRPSAARSVSAQVRQQLADPLLLPVGRGDLTPTSAARVFGVRDWQGSQARASCMISFGVDQVAALPLRGNTDLVVFLIGRSGADFTDAELALLHSVRPAVTSLGMLLRLPGMSVPEPAPTPTGSGLTGREVQVLELLAHGYKAAVIARLAGCSTRTVHRHLGHIYDKLGVSDRLSAVNQAHLLGVIATDAAAVREEVSAGPQVVQNHSPG